MAVKAGFDPNQVRDPHTGEWIDAPGLPDWFWGDDEIRFGVEVPEGVVDSGIEPGTQAAAAAKAYTTGSYRDLNQRLMHAEPLTPEQEAIAQALHGEMRDLPEPVTVFRGVHHIGPTGYSEDETLQLLRGWATEHFRPGDTLELGGFQSTSFDTTPALDASLSRYSPGIMFEILAKNGAYLGRVTEFDDEDELLLAGGSFQVRKVLMDVEFIDSAGESRRRVVVQVIQL